MAPRASLSALVLLAAAGIGLTFSPVEAASSWIHLTPGKVRLSTKAKLTGSGLGARQMYSFILQVPHAPKPFGEQFIGVARTSSTGTVAVTVKIPLVPRCGNAKVIALNAQTKRMVSTAIVLTGCTGTGPGTLPPLPKHPITRVKGHH